jgi:AcrR family transcriptional regulator
MPTESITTYERILAAATAVFMEGGYRKATFREICRRAKANTAAINYHFRDKDGLYREVLERVIAESRTQRDQEALAQAAPAEQRLRGHVRRLLRGLLHTKDSTALLSFMSREIAEPTEGLDVMLEKVIRPFHRQLSQVVRELIGPTASDQQVFDCVQCIVGQCNHFRFAQPVISRLGPYPNYDEASVEHLVEHIVRFSLGGLHAQIGAAESAQGV